MSDKLQQSIKEYLYAVECFQRQLKSYEQALEAHLNSADKIEEKITESKPPCWIEYIINELLGQIQTKFITLPGTEVTDPNDERRIKYMLIRPEPNNKKNNQVLHLTFSLEDIEECIIHMEAVNVENIRNKITFEITPSTKLRDVLDNLVWGWIRK